MAAEVGETWGILGF